MTSFTNPDLSWTPVQLHDALNSSAFDEGNLKVMDVRLGEDYATGHIPGAIHFSTYALNTYDTDPAPLRSFTHMWAFLLAQRGIGPQHELVVYEDSSGMNAARALWFLEYLGYPRVHILDGGLNAWREQGYDITQAAQAPKSIACNYEVQPHRVATYLDVLDAIDNPETIILDTRSAAEFDGTDGRAARNGHVPTSVHQDWRTHLDDTGRLLDAQALQSLFVGAGCTSDKRIIALCNTGYRSAHAYWVLRLLGYPDVRNYVGSWQEWGNREECPVVTN
jgi:thiosulfate/3-mercaptopyruvate sulfurtransferase